MVRWVTENKHYNNRGMMTKTVIIPDNTHLLIIKKQIEIREKYGITPRITDMLVAYINEGLDKTEELLNIKTDNSSDINQKISISNQNINQKISNEKISIIKDADVST